MKEKAIFCFFKELSVAKNCLRPGSAPSNYFVKDLTKNNLIFKIQVNAKNFCYNWRKSSVLFSSVYFHVPNRHLHTTYFIYFQKIFKFSLMSRSFFWKLFTSTTPAKDLLEPFLTKLNLFMWREKTRFLVSVIKSRLCSTKDGRFQW